MCVTVCVSVWVCMRGGERFFFIHHFALLFDIILVFLFPFFSLSLSLSFPIIFFLRGCCSFPSDFTEPAKEPNRAKRPSRFRRSKQTEAAQQQKFPNHEGNWMTAATIALDLYWPSPWPSCHLSSSSAPPPTCYLSLSLFLSDTHTHTHGYTHSHTQTDVVNHLN